MDLSIDVISEAEDVESDDIRIYKPTELITIKGSGNVNIFGLSNKFNSEFPSELISKIAPEEFNATIGRINSILSKTVPINAKWLICGCLCCFCTLGCSFFPVVCLSKRTRLSLEKLLEWENNQLYHKLGLHWRVKKQQCTTNSLTEYVLIIEIFPKIPLYSPD